MRLFSRRRFLQTSAWAVVGSHVWNAETPAQPSESPTAGDTSRASDASRGDGQGAQMTLGFSTYGMKTLSTEEAVRQVAKIGFDSIEIAVRPDWDAAPQRMSSRRRSRIRKQLHDSGLLLTSFMEHLQPSAGKQQHARDLQRLKNVFQLAHDLAPENPPLVQTTLGGGRWDDKKHLFRDRVGDWAEAGRSAGVLVCIKPHRGGALSRPIEAKWLIEQLDTPQCLRMVYDYSHYAFRDMPLEETVRTALPITAHVAVKDTVKRNGKTAFVLPGESGNMDYPRLLSLLKQGGYRGDVSCEVSGMVWGQSDYDPLAAARTCYQNMARVFRKVGLH